jgi:hypothetical protein
MCAPASVNNEPLYEYTLVPTHMRSLFGVGELQDIELAEPFSFTKGCRTMRIKARPGTDAHQFGSLLFDLANDPGQEHPIDDPAVEEMMIRHMVRLMQENDAPPEQFERLGLTDWM